MEGEKSTKWMGKQFLQIPMYVMVNWKLKWNINLNWNNHYWKLNKTTVIKQRATALLSLKNIVYILW